MKFPWFPKRKKSVVVPAAPDDQPLTPVRRMSDSLRRIGAHTGEITHPDDTETVSQMNFTFQNERFTLFIEKDSTQVQIAIPEAITTEATNLNEVRYLTNRCNTVLSSCHATYITSDDMSEIGVAVVTHFPLTDISDKALDDLTSSALSRMFDFRQKWELSFRELIRMRADRDPFDVEAEFTHRLRKLHLTRMTETVHTPDSPDPDHTHPVSDLIPTIGQYLTAVTGHIPDGRATVISPGGVLRVFAPGEAAGHGLLDDIWPESKRGNIPGFAFPWVIIRIEGTRPNEDEPSDIPSTGVTLLLTDYGHDRDSGYISVTVTSDGADATLCGGPASEAWRPVASRNVIAAPTASATKARSEYDYMLHDAREKIMAGQTERLTPAQHMVMHAFVADTGFQLYHGTRLFLNSRFVQAAILIEDVYDDMKGRYAGMDTSARKAFLEVCYMLGHCYASFGRYKTAYYYLSSCINQGNYNHDMEFINCLVNAGDYRAYDILDNAIREFEEIPDKTDIPPAAVDMYNFMRRRRAYFCIMTGRIEEAESQLRTMVDEDSNREFAISELAHINRLRKS